MAMTLTRELSPMAHKTSNMHPSWKLYCQQNAVFNEPRMAVCEGGTRSCDGATEWA